MFTVLLVLHLLIASALVGVILLQRSEGGALGSLGGGAGGFMTGRGAANVLTRTTAILFGCFLLTSISLSVVGGLQDKKSSILDAAPTPSTTPTPSGVPGDSGAPAPTPAPVTPAVPLPE